MRNNSKFLHNNGKFLFLNRLNEALRQIPKDLPGEDEWGHRPHPIIPLRRGIDEDEKRRIAEFIALGTTVGWVAHSSRSNTWILIPGATDVESAFDLSIEWFDPNQSAGDLGEMLGNRGQRVDLRQLLSGEVTFQ